jgi:hypothetical protein
MDSSDLENFLHTIDPYLTSGEWTDEEYDSAVANYLQNHFSELFKQTVQLELPDE